MEIAAASESPSRARARAFGASARRIRREFEAMLSDQDFERNDDFSNPPAVPRHASQCVFLRHNGQGQLQHCSAFQTGWTFPQLA